MTLMIIGMRVSPMPRSTPVTTGLRAVEELKRGGDRQQAHTDVDDALIGGERGDERRGQRNRPDR
jgi:hypothetical protein